MKTLEKLTPSASLSGGYTSDGLQKQGPRMTFMAVFSGLTGQTKARLEQSVDGTKYNEIPDSETTIASGNSEQMWNDIMLPEGSFVRLAVDAVAGTLTEIKMLS
jgi:hypothetical protein